MTKQLWMNLPVKDVARSRAFFTALGFSFDPKFGNSADCACLKIGENNVVVMLFAEHLFKGFAQQPITDTAKSTEVLFSIDAESRKEVDEMAKKVAAAGGNIYGQPGEKDGWMYGFGFGDPDGHRWNMLYMDMAKMPGTPSKN